MLSETLTDGSGTPGAPPLGRLLIVHGFLTEEQLQVGLAEHGRTGLPLGQVLIGLGFVTKAIIAQALATQAGGLVKTEYGFSTGFAASKQTAPLQFASAPAPEADPQPVEPAPQPEAEIIPLRQEDAPVETPMQIEAPAEVAAPAQVESPAHAWSAPPEVAIPAPAPAPVAEIQPEPIQPEPVAEIQPEPIAEIQPEPTPVASHEQAEAALATAAARIHELQAQLREQQRLTEASEAKLAEIALDAEIARNGLNAAVQEFNALKQEVAGARQMELELRDENERLASAGPDPTPARELQVVRMEIASMRNELATVVEALRDVHARLGEHSATVPAPPVPDAPAPAGAYQLASN
jgi:hypothetical protein